MHIIYIVYIVFNFFFWEKEKKIDTRTGKEKSNVGVEICYFAMITYHKRILQTHIHITIEP